MGSGGSVGARPYRYDRRRPAPLRYALHDRLGPGLAHLQLRLELLATAEPPSGLARTQLRSLQHEVSGLVRELGRIVHAEPPELLADRGLVAAIRAACHRAERPGTAFRFSVSGRPVPLPSAVSELLYRAALEGTANVTRHAQANRCLVRLTYTSSMVSLEVRDDGRGPPAQGVDTTAEAGGLGLAALRRDARRLGGAARLREAPSGGTRLQVRLPLTGRTRHERQGNALANWRT